MAAFETEEQQVEALKDWWKKNGTAVIAGVVLGIAALIGWRGWSWHQEKQAVEASDIFVIAQQAVIKNDAELLKIQVDTLRVQYKSTPYAVLATLLEARANVESGDLAAAAENLRWAIDHSSQESVQDIARIRLARVLVADNKLDEAAAIINHGLPKSYSSLVNEIRGDIFLEKGEIEQAKQAYDRALESIDAGSVEYLQMKRNDLGG